MKLTIVGCSPAWPNAGGAQSGYIVEGPGKLLLDCGPGVLARLRERDNWPQVDAIAITHFHLDHWGDLVPWVWGRMYGLGRDLPVPELWVQPGGRAELEEFGERLGMRDMFERTFTLHEYAENEPFEAAGLEVTALRLPHYALETYGFRVSNERHTLAYSGDTGPSDRLAELARDVDLFVCEATLERGELDGQPRGHLALDEALAAYGASGARRLLITHRPQELPVDGSLELAYDGLELEI
ncbi:MAG TPA: MBL fold metallo-hydrolase [Gaiellaceae bacterium]